MMLRRAGMLAFLVAYLGVGVCRQACVLDMPVLRSDAGSVGASSGHCGRMAPTSREGTSRSHAPCCARRSGNASVLLPAQAMVLRPVAFSVDIISFAVQAPRADDGAPSYLDAGA
ncbi:MAG: hypothetical protein KGL74_07345, partial [Elusimicrobia bacterium]|nr:hypothetical protein [Elusimicrobiota bacterium]